MTLLDGQEFISPNRGMPVETLDDSTRIDPISGETVQLYYDNAGTPTADAGQPAGTMVAGALAQKNVMDFLGSRPASENNTSLSFTSTALTILVAMPSVYQKWDTMSFTARLAAASAFLNNGEYFVDGVHGEIIGKKASTQTSLTSTSYKVPVRGGSSSFTIGSVITEAIFNAVQPTLGDGDTASLQADSRGNLRTTLGTGLNETDDSVEAMIAASATATGVEPEVIDALTNVAQNVSSGPGNLYKVKVVNKDTVNTAYVLLYDLAAGSVTVGTTVPNDITPVPAGAVVIEDLSPPYTFATRLSAAVVVTDHTGNTAPSTAATVSFHIKE